MAKSSNWAVQLGIADGDWLTATKGQFRVVMGPTFCMKARVWACGMLATQGYGATRGGQKAYTVRDKKQGIVDLTHQDIASQLNTAAIRYYEAAGVELTDEQRKALRPDRHDIRRALAGIERDGCCERTTSDGRKLSDLPLEERRKLANGDNIRLLFFPVPRPPTLRQSGREVGTNAHLIAHLRIKETLPGLRSEDSHLLASLFNSTKVDFPAEVGNTAHLQEQVERALQDYKKARKVGAETVVEVVLQCSSLIRKVNPVIKSENPPPPPPFSTVLEPAPPEQKAEEEDASYINLKSLYPKTRLDEGKVKPAFESLPLKRRQEVLVRLKVYLGCDRWVRSLADDGGRYVPLASNWLPTCDAEPPPYLQPNGGNHRNASVQEVVDLMKHQDAVIAAAKQREKEEIIGRLKGEWDALSVRERRYYLEVYPELNGLAKGVSP